MDTPIRIGIVTVSDRASRGEYEDRGGPAVEEWLGRALTTAWQPERRLVPDDVDAIGAALVDLADTVGVPLIITTGGTGPAPRDVTPEATAAVCERMLPGFGEQMRRASLEIVPTAILSRQEAGTRGATMIINVPGNPSAVADSLNAVFAAVPYAIELLGAPRIETDPEVCVAFRPGHARS